MPVAVVVLVIDQTFSSLSCSDLGFHHERAQGNLFSSEFLVRIKLFIITTFISYLTLVAAV